MKVNESVFKAYDIRGKYPVDINEDLAERVGEAMVVHASQGKNMRGFKVLVVHDIRVSSPSLKSALIRGIISQGADVIDAETGTTPYFYFLLHKIKPDAAIMITASHNPADNNGFKLKIKGESVYAGHGMEEIKKMVLAGEFKKSGNLGKIIKGDDCRDEYLRFISKGVFIKKEIKTAVDASSGATTLFLPRLLSIHPNISYKPLFFEADGTFSKHLPNPLLPESQQFVKEELNKGKYNFGVVFDGDGDRVIFFDERGNFIKSEFILGLFAEKELEKTPNAVFVMPVNTSRGLREKIKERGGKIKLSKVGYVFVRELMIKHKAPYGVEISGHFHFKDFYYAESGFLTFLKLAEIVSQAGKPLSELIKPFRTYVSSDEVNFKVENKEAIMEKVKKSYKDGEISELDGVTVEFEDWWFNIRPSNTEALVRLVLEAKDKELFDIKFREVRQLLTD